MFSKLWARFALIIGLALLCWGILGTYPLKPGIDLAGGVDMVYELDLSKASGDVKQLAAQVIEVFKRRIDPTGTRNLTWRAVAGGTRIEIQMPLASDETKQARDRFDRAKNALSNSNLRVAEINAALRRTGADRTAALDKLAVAGTPRRALLDKLAEAYDARQKLYAQMNDFAAKKQVASPEVLDQLTASEKNYAQALSNVQATNVDMVRLGEMLEESDDPHNNTVQAELDKLPDQYPQQKDLIKSVLAEYQNLQLHRGSGFDDPADLQRMLKGAGVLDFRIAVRETDAPLDVAQARQQFRDVGPAKTKVPKMAWFEIDPKNGASLMEPGRTSYVFSEDHKYMLLYTDVGRALTHDTESSHRQEWRLVAANTGHDPASGAITVEFKFDQTGGAYFGQLTTNNVDQPMVILLDDRAISVANINEPITGGSGRITFGTASESRSIATIQKDADTVVQILQAGSLPATLRPEPVSVFTVGSELGQDNVNKGLKSGVYAVIAVMVFMMVYYTLTGSFADLAVMFNLAMTLSAMAVLGATFTLPGIAGIVLTLGMAVDANVLINERIREEMHRGASLWHAVKQGYDKVFWTIFDANTTTSATSIVLIFVGSEEVKGFGVTLLIGLMVHMFTALFVTRTLMIAGIRWGILKHIDDHSIAEYIREIFTLTWLRKGRWPFMRVITVTNFDWIGKRHYFWAVSTFITLAGITAFWIRGSDKYDTEFNGGTQITFRLTKPTSIEKVRQSITTEMSDELAADAKKDPAKSAEFEQMSRDIAQSHPVAIGKEETDFQLVTTISEPTERQELIDRLVKKFGDDLDVQRKLSFRGVDLPDKVTPESLIANKLAFPLNDPSLDKDIQGVSALDFTEQNNADNNDVSAYVGGVAILLDDITPPQSAADLSSRLAHMREQPDFKKAQNRDVKVLPVQFTTADHSIKGKLSRALIVAADPNISYNAESSNDTWLQQVVSTEWSLAHQALTAQSSLQGVASFDPVVAAAAKGQAVVATVISLALIVLYVWFRFGGLRYGMGAILSLVHDAIVAVAATVLSGELVKHAPGLASHLLVSDFKINLTMIAAYLTIVGYSVNDTIVIFDRIRENRGRAMTPLSAKLVNDSINQCFGRTIWTTFTVFIVVLIMYVWGGEGVRGFSFAMLIGVFTGAYSTLAIAAPALLNVRERAQQPVITLARIEEDTNLGQSGLAPEPRL